jgi:hypothetical protein
MRGGFWIGLSLCLWQASAAGAEELASFSVDYAAPAVCPSREQFVNAVSLRARNAVEVPGGAKFAFQVQLRSAGAQASGALVTRLEDGREFRREIPPASCAEVASSIAVIAAMVLDGGENSLKRQEPAPATAAPDADPRTTAAVDPQPGSPRPTAGVEPRPAAMRPPRGVERRRSEPRVSAPATPDARPLGVLVALGGGLRTGVAPEPSWGASPGVELALGRSARSAISARVSGTFVRSGTEVTPYGDAQFQLLAAELSGCAPRYPAALLGVRPCLFAQAGDLRGEGQETLNRHTRHMLWLGLGAATRLEAEVSRRFVFEIQVHGVRLVRSDRFVFEPDVVAHDVPDWALGLHAGVSMRVF